MNKFEIGWSKLAIWLILTSLLLILLSCSNVRNVRNFNQKKIYKEMLVTSAPNINLNTQLYKIENVTRLPVTSDISNDNIHSMKQMKENNEDLQSCISNFQDELEYLRQEVKTLAEIILKLRAELNNAGIYSETITEFESDKNITNRNDKKKSIYEERKLSKKLLSGKSLAKNNRKVGLKNINRKSEIKYDKSSNSSQENKEFIAELEDILKGIRTNKLTESLIKLHILRNKTNDNSYQNSIIDYWIGEVYYLTKDYENALSYFRKASGISNSPKRDKAILMIAECLSRLGKINEAKKAYQKFIQDYPFSEYISRAKKMIQQL